MVIVIFTRFKMYIKPLGPKTPQRLRSRSHLIARSFMTFILSYEAKDHSVHSATRDAEKNATLKVFSS